MKRAMIITVGNGPEVENSITYTIRRHNPNFVMFCCSDTTKNKVAVVRKNLESSLNDEQIIIFEDKEINDFEYIFDIYCSQIELLKQMGFASDEIVADYTTGTKVMSSALTTAALLNGLDSICYVYSINRDNTYGRSENAGMRASSLTPNLIYTKLRIDSARKYFNKFQYDAAAGLLRNDIHSKYNEECEWLLMMTNAYHSWDKFQFQQARDYFSHLTDHTLTVKYNLKDIILSHKKHAGKLLHQTELYAQFIKYTNNQESVPEEEKKLLSQQIAYELIDNARRRYLEGKYDDAVARLYRALESIAQSAFVKATGFVNTKAPLKHLPAALQETYGKYNDKGKITLALRDTYYSLASMNDKLGEEYMKQENKWLYLLEKRNNSILAHGTDPVTKEHYEEFYKMITGLLTGYTSIKWPGL